MARAGTGRARSSTPPRGVGPDPFATAALRTAVLDAWAASPTRFREDANAEEDLRLGGYADTWFVELVQNAADAAGEAGRVRVTVVDAVPDAPAPDPPELRVANTGTPLTGAGVDALASLRASAKRDTAGSVGRFGVGFAAVLAISDAPRVVSVSGGVAFSAARTAEAVEALPGPAEELARRVAPPILRMAWPSDERPPAGFATEVRLPLRPGTDAAALLAHARASAPDLLLALPALREIDVAGHLTRRTERDGIVTVGARRWRVVRRSGDHDAAAVADVAVEQRDRRAWAVTWALPLDRPLGDDVVHAPTATAEAVALPARLIATVALEPDRRRVRPGAATDAVLDGAAAAYVDLVRAVAPAERMALVPEPGFPRSPLHGHLRARIVAALRTGAWLPAPSSEEGHRQAAEPRDGHPADDHPAAVRALVPQRAEWLDVPGVGAVLPALLVAAGFDRLAAPPYRPAALVELGARRISAAELVERLFGVDRPAPWWCTLYTELALLADTVPGLTDDLRALPVPLVDGRRAVGPATVLLPEPGTADGVSGLALPGLHLADPGVAHPLLRRLGAVPAGPAALLAHPALRAAIERSVDDAEAGLDPAPLAEAVLALVGAGGPVTETLPALALPAADGRRARADELVLPDAALRPLLAPDGPLAVLDAEWAARFPREILVAVGVLDGFAVVVDEDPLGPDHDLDDEDRWWDGLTGPPPRLVAVRDLDLVDDAAWPAALALLTAERITRAATLSGYTPWWLARHARIGGHRPSHWRLPSATALSALYDPLPPFPAAVSVDEAALVAIGVRRDLTVADAEGATDLLARLADPRRRLASAAGAAAHGALADAVVDGRLDVAAFDPPEYVRAMDGGVAHVDAAVVLDAPWAAAVLPAAHLVVGGDPRVLADLLDLPLAGEIVAGDVEGDGEWVTWADLGEIVVACHSLGVEVPDGGFRRHGQLWVALRRPTTGRRRVPVWRDGAGGWHAEDPVRALLALLAR